MVSFCIVNQATDAQLPAVLPQIAAALDVQANRDLSPFWPCNVRVRAATPDNPPATGDIVCLITDDLPDAPGAVAYHSWEGVPDIFAGRNLCSSLTSGNGSLSQALSHEMCEELGDPAANLWADDGSGGQVALELCDAVESNSYDISGIGVSDFLLPAFFAPGTVAPYSFSQANGGSSGPPAPFTVGPGGYQIVRTSTGQETQVTGEVPAGKLAKKKSRTSRSFRRGLRLP